MKNLQDIQKEVDEIVAELIANKNRKAKDPEKKKASVISRMKKRRDYLLVCIDYLKTSPTDEFIEKEKERLMNRNNKIMEGMPKGQNGQEVSKKTKRDYEKLMDLPKIRLQLRTLQFIS